MASKHPVHLIKDAAVGTVKDPLGTAGKAVGQAVGGARGTVAVARMVVAAVGSRLPVPAVLRPANPGASETPTSATSSHAQAVEADASRKVHGDPLEPAVVRATAPPAKKTPTTKAPVAQAPARQAPAKRAPAKKAPAKKAPGKRAPAKKAPVTTIDATADANDVEATPADVAEVIAKKEPASEPLIDPSLTKAVAKEAATGAGAASTEKG